MLELFYLYDSSVPNSKKLATGDLVVVRGKESAHGAGWVRQIAVEPGATKVRKRCPQCGETGFKPRSTRATRFLCLECGHEFDEGLLLRGDVHRLLDRGLLAVHPDTLEVHVAPRRHGYPAYRVLHGRKMTVSPSRQALADHFKVATATWA